jgi:hypothetical protein
MSDTRDLSFLFDETMLKIIYKEIMDSRKCVGDDKFTYDTIEKSNRSKTYTIESRHMPFDEVRRFSNSSCKECNGTGKKLMDVEKGNIPNTQDFIMLSSESYTNLTEEQKKIAIDREKTKKFWRIALPCRCTLKNMLKNGLLILSNSMGNIVIELTCTEKI